MLDKLMDKSGPDHGQIIQTQTTRNSTQVAETRVKVGQHWIKKNEIVKNEMIKQLTASPEQKRLIHLYSERTTLKSHNISTTL